jgi:Zn finger protein HypA/HybF involved in hydrogenase expression
MENRISALENDMGDVKSMVKKLIEKIHSQSIAIGELGKQMGKKVDGPAGEESDQMQQQCVVLSELRKRIDRMLLPQREEIQKVKIEIGDDSKKEKLQVKNAEKVIKSGSLQNLTNLEQSSEPSNWKLQSHKESVDRLDAAIEKKEADNRAVNIKVNQMVAIDSPLPELPNTEREIEKTKSHRKRRTEGVSDETVSVEQRMKEHVAVFEAPPLPEPTKESLHVLVFPPPPKPPDLVDSVIVNEKTRMSTEIYRHLSMKRPPPEPPNAGSQPLMTNKNVSLLTEAREVHTHQVHAKAAAVRKGLEKARVKREIEGKLSNISVIHVFPLIGKLIASLNLIMGHIEKKFTIWAEETMREKAQFSKVEFWKLVQEQGDAGMSLVVKPVYSKLFYNVFKCVSNDMVAHPARMDLNIDSRN